MMKKLEGWILHPFLFGIYPVAALLTLNLTQVGPMFAIRPALVALLLAGLLVGAFRLLLRNWRRAALVTSLSVLFIFLYGHVHNLIVDVQVAGVEIGKHRYLSVVWLVLYAAGLWFVIKKVKDLQSWTRTLNIVAILLLGISLVQITVYEIRSIQARQRVQSDATNPIASQLDLPEGISPPDIYYIILDTYTRQDALQQAFGYDNFTFVSSLEQAGFYIAGCSQSNYNSTAPSLTSSLNMQYLDQLDARLSPPNTSLSDLFPYLQNNTALLTLQNLGYNFIAMESGYSLTEFTHADLYLSPQSDFQNLQLTGGLSPFETLLLRTSIGNFFYDTHFFPRSLENSLFDAAYLTHRDRIFFELDRLADIPSLPGPKFIFVHILAPHNPFVFGPQGEYLNRTTPFTLNDDVDAMDINSYISGFTGQVTYLNRRVLETVNKILDQSTNPPVIIIQGDHGSPRTPAWNMTILNAYYLPFGGDQSLYSSISPVNTFRVILNAYFGGKLELLPDLACDAPSDDPFNCVVASDPDPACILP